MEGGSAPARRRANVAMGLESLSASAGFLGETMTVNDNDAHVVRKDRRLLVWSLLLIILVVVCGDDCIII